MAISPNPGLPSGVSTTIVPILQGVPVIGDVLAAAATLFVSLAKGKTGHFSYDAVIQTAYNEGHTIFQGLAQHFTDDQLAKASVYTAKRFLVQMEKNWGLGPSLNQVIAKDVGSNAGQYVQSQNPLDRQLMNFFVWIWTNIDQARPETFNQFAPVLFQAVYVTGFQDAGYSGIPVELATTIGGIVGGNVGTGGGSSTVGTGAGSAVAGTGLAGLTSSPLAIVLVVGIVGAIVYSIAVRK